MIKAIKGSLIIFVLFQIACNLAFGYEVETHVLLNTRVYDISSIDEYFHDELGYRLFETGENKGRIDNTFQGKLAIALFKQAGVDEDSPNTWCWPIPLPPTPYPRAYNHYHDPLRGWEEAGYTNPLWYNGISSVLWAQYDRLRYPPDLSMLRCTGPNVWTWGNANRYFLDGLTSRDGAAREQNLADLFTALGRLTHLVADMSVPEHTRNDAHVILKHFDHRLKSMDHDIIRPLERYL